VATRLLLEGPDLAELMAHVRAELGPTARVVRAERVRTGGIAGFFAREKYELTVDVPDPEPVPLRARRPAPPREVAGGIETLLAAADAFDELPDGEHAVSTGGATFAGVLEQVRQMAGAPAPADVEVPVAPGLPEDDELTAADAPPGDSARPGDGGSPEEGARPSRGGASSQTDPEPDEEDAGSARLRTGLRGLGVPDRLLGAGPVTLSTVLSGLPAAPAAPRAPGAVIVVVGDPQDVDPVADLLAERLRLDPDRVLAAGAGDSGRRATVRATTAEDIARWRLRAGAGPQAAVVALGIGPGAEDRRGAGELLRACRAEQVWAVVDARTKTADVVRWLEEVGGSRGIDAVAVRGLFDTTQPGSVLDLGVPVAWIDGVPATTVAWAAALSQALGERARWD